MSLGYLLDTNVPSELRKPVPDARVRSWVESRDDLYLSVVSVGEMWRGISLLPHSNRRAQLEQWLALDLVPLFGSRILPVTYTIADRWGRIGADCQLRGVSMPLADALIAATALQYDLAIATRNVKDFVGLGLEIVNPWES